MMPAIHFPAIFTFILVIIILYLVGYLLLVPFKWLLRILVNSVLGGLMLFGLNALFAGWGVAIALNLWTALVAGILGVPGIILLLLLQIVL